jgi:hypothetical protein
MTEQPDTLLTSAKKLASAAKLPWPVVQKVYRELQEADLLPLSQGRRIWYATPELVASLCMGLAFRASGSKISDLVKYFEHSTRGGDGWMMHSLITRLGSFLADPTEASKLVRVVFEMDLLRAKVIHRDGDEEVTSEYFHEDDTADSPENTEGSPLITNWGVISGAVFQILSSEIIWGSNSPPTFRAQIESPAE